MEPVPGLSWIRAIRYPGGMSGSPPLVRPLRRRKVTHDPSPAVDLEVVVARYREPVNWTRNLPATVRVSLYDKGGDLPADLFPWARIVRLPNVGLEAHTYLEHILTRWDQLAPVTLFCQGHPFDHVWDLHDSARDVVAGREIVKTFRWLGNLLDTDDERGRRLFTKWSKNRDGRELRVDLFHQQLFGAPLDGLLHFRLGAQFMVTAEAIRSRSKDFWEHARQLSLGFPDAGHCFERLWDRVFGIRAIDPASLGPDGFLDLKPFKGPRNPPPPRSG